jgi:hypothetical protein
MYPSKNKDEIIKSIFIDNGKTRDHFVKFTSDKGMRKN